MVFGVAVRVRMLVPGQNFHFMLEAVAAWRTVVRLEACCVYPKKHTHRARIVAVCQCFFIIIIPGIVCCSHMRPRAPLYVCFSNVVRSSSSITASVTLPPLTLVSCRWCCLYCCCCAVLKLAVDFLLFCFVLSYFLARYCVACVA